MENAHRLYIYFFSILHNLWFLIFSTGVWHFLHYIVCRAGVVLVFLSNEMIHKRITSEESFFQAAVDRVDQIETFRAETQRVSIHCYCHCILRLYSPWTSKHLVIDWSTYLSDTRSLVSVQCWKLHISVRLLYILTTISNILVLHSTPLVVRPGQTRSMPWLLMPWLHKEPGH